MAKKNAPKRGIVKSGEITIGKQIWMDSNLNVTSFRNGDPIFEAQTDEEWRKASNENLPAWCYYEQDEKNGKKYGFLYNWYAVNDPRGLAPEGWHIPSDAEWKKLIDFLGADTAGKKLKTKRGWGKEEPGFPGGPGSDEVGFSGMPGGVRLTSFNFLGDDCYLWTSQPGTSSTSICKILGGARDTVRHWVSPANAGMYVRCVKGPDIIWK